MLFVLFKLGQDRFALDASRVAEVVPLVGLKRMPAAPEGVAGIFNYRGRFVPVVDLCELVLGRPAAEQISTRVIVVHYPDADGRDHLLGLIAEQATEVLRRERSDFVSPDMRATSAPYLGPVLIDHQGVIQWINEQHLLSPGVRRLLFSETAALVHGSD